MNTKIQNLEYLIGLYSRDKELFYMIVNDTKKLRFYGFFKEEIIAEARNRKIDIIIEL